jgi:acetyl esterase/lipase
MTEPADDGFEERVDPQIRAALDSIPRLDLADITLARRERAELAARAAARQAPPPTVRTDDRLVPGHAGDPDVLVRIHRPVAPTADAAALLWVHGGGHVLGAAAQDDPMLQDLVARTGCIAVAVDWRRSPESPYPAALHDAYAGLCWLSASHHDLGIDAGRIVLGGASSGGGVAAATALLARDRGEVPIAGQLLVYPMLDDRALTPSSRMVQDPRLWNVESNRLGWAAYLGVLSAEGVPAYAAPGRAADLAGLPPAWIGTGELDGFRDEDISFASRLLVAGVPTELHVYPGAVHGFDLFAPDAAISVRFRRDRDEAFDRFLGERVPAGTPSS